MMTRKEEENSTNRLPVYDLKTCTLRTELLVISRIRGRGVNLPFPLPLLLDTLVRETGIERHR